MADVDETVLDEAGHEGESMSPVDLVALVEHHSGETPGVDRETLAAYANALEARGDYDFDADRFLDRVDDRVIDTESWSGMEQFYALGDGRISKYPAEWHDRLGGSTDAAAYVRVITDRAPDFAEFTDREGVAPAVAKDDLIDVIEVVGGVDRETAAGAIERARDDGRVGEYADQHPQTGVYATDRGDR